MVMQKCFAFNAGPLKVISKFLSKGYIIIISAFLFINCLVFDKFTLKGTFSHVRKKNITATNRDHVLFAFVFVIVDK